MKLATELVAENVDRVEVDAMIKHLENQGFVGFARKCSEVDLPSLGPHQTSIARFDVYRVICVDGMRGPSPAPRDDRTLGPLKDDRAL